MISDAEVRHTGTWLAYFRGTYLDNIPMQIHERGLDRDGKPDWSFEMRQLMTGIEKQSTTVEPGKVRVRRAMKRIRLRSLREYEVLYRIMILGESVEQVTQWLNERAVNGGHPERYSINGTTVIIYAAVDKLCAWY